MLEEVVKDREETPAQEPQFLQLDELTLYKLRTFEAERKAASYLSIIRKAARDGYLRQIDPGGHLRKLEVELEASNSDATKAELAYRELVDEIETRLGVKLSDFSFDDETGRLYPQVKE